MANSSLLSKQSEISTQSFDEHRKEDTPVGQFVRQCGSDSGKPEKNWKLVGQIASRFCYSEFRRLTSGKRGGQLMRLKNSEVGR